jgi:allophanate hydrolase subunit 2
VAATKVASKRGRASRAKGGRGEREAAAALGDVLGRPWRRAVGQSRSGADAPDVEPDGWAVGGPSATPWVEVKRGRSTITAAMRQAVAACGARLPVVVTRQDRGEWLVTVRLADLARLWAWLDAVLEPAGEGEA